MGYRLSLTDADLRTIAFVGSRYAWSEALLALEAGQNELTESEAWCIAEAFDSDAEGGHSMFPMLDPRSALAEKLAAFRNSIV